jgi:hypothetical protein
MEEMIEITAEKVVNSLSGYSGEERGVMLIKIAGLLIDAAGGLPVGADGPEHELEEMNL